jgi:hypothetical protein
MEEKTVGMRTRDRKARGFRDPPGGGVAMKKKG